MLLAMVGMTLQGKAQTNKVPTIQKFVKVTTTGVNFRQKPDAKSKKLGWYSKGNGTFLEWLPSNANYRNLTESTKPSCLLQAKAETGIRFI